MNTCTGGGGGGTEEGGGENTQGQWLQYYSYRGEVGREAKKRNNNKTLHSSANTTKIQGGEGGRREGHC